MKANFFKGLSVGPPSGDDKEAVECVSLAFRRRVCSREDNFGSWLQRFLRVRSS